MCGSQCSVACLNYYLCVKAVYIGPFFDIVLFGFSCGAVCDAEGAEYGICGFAVIANIGFCLFYGAYAVLLL